MFERDSCVHTRTVLGEVLLLDDDDPDEVRRMLFELRVACPQSAAIHLLLGKLYCTEFFVRGAPGARDAALQEFATAVKIAPEDEQASMCLALARWLAGEKDGAIHEIGRFLAVGRAVHYWEAVDEILRLERTDERIGAGTLPA